MLSATRNTWDVEDNWIAFHGPRNTWDVEDNWIAFHGLGGLGDPVDDVITTTTDPSNKVRLSAAIALGKRAVTLSTDKRAIPAMLVMLGDVDPNIRAVAASAFAIPGWVDATVDGCIRNRLIAQLDANASVDPNAIAKAKAAAAHQLMIDLGMVDQAHLPIDEKCGVVRLPPLVNVGKLVDPNAPPAGDMSTNDKLALVTATAVLLGVVAYAVLGRKHPAQVRKRVKRR
jgi:hypothetical protein